MGEGGVVMTCSTEVVDEVSVNFQILRLGSQIYVWMGCSKLGELYAAAPTRANNGVSVSRLVGGGCDNTASCIARRIVLKTGLNVILATHFPNYSPLLLANAEKILMDKLLLLGYAPPPPPPPPTSST